jgi:hypothetical protein
MEDCLLRVRLSMEYGDIARGCGQDNVEGWRGCEGSLET